MEKESRDLWGFLRQIDANPRDTDTRSIFADWLDEHDCPEEADAQRKLVADIMSGKLAANEYLDEICVRRDITRAELDEMVAEQYVGSHELLRDEICGNDEFWRNYEAATGKTLDEDTKTTYFSCSC